MCFSFLSYFPAEKTRRRCNAWRDTSPCDWKDNDNIALGCDFRSLRLDNPEMRHLVSNVTKKCLPGFCKVECLLYVREIKKLPCFVGDADKYARYIALVEKPQNNTLQYISNFYAALDSCDKELMDEQIHALKTAFNMEKKESEINGSCVMNRCDNECGVSSAETVVFGVQVFIFVTMLHHVLFGYPVF
ncbi:uncharacterized protein LOC123546596 [Mercenaria mercenaria]|uniref:uncharacterized protein LOC123546596 n=1 Tax=Mercenaria mercenaria TaxID=6596 RepID=UPI00234EE686|nr:uncharacterized protein LOC123546596 [Mercenaria mercenaria]